MTNSIEKNPSCLGDLIPNGQFTGLKEPQAPFPLDISQRLTPASINSCAKIEYAILANSNPYERLRTAENIVDEKNDALELAEINITALEQKILLKESQLPDLQGVEKIDTVAEIQRFALENRKYQKLKRDTEAELATAIRIKHHILQQHPRLAKISYEEMQQKVSYYAYAENLANILVEDLVPMATGIPQSVVNFNLSSSPDLRTEVLAILQIKLAQLDSTLPQTMEVISSQNGFLQQKK